MGSFCRSNEMVVQRKEITCCTTCLHKDYILMLHSYFAMLANYKLPMPPALSDSCITLEFISVPYQL